MRLFSIYIKQSLTSMLLGWILINTHLADARFFKVTTAADDGAGSFRQAINDVNQSPEQNIIEFDIPVAAGQPAVIALTTPLPAIREKVCINGFSQPGSKFATRDSIAELKVVIDGTPIWSQATEQEESVRDLPEAVAGLFFNAGSEGSVLTGVAVVGFSDPETIVPGTALVLASDNNQVWGTWVGAQPGEFLAKPNETGILIAGSNNEIGGEAPAASVLVSNNVKWGIEVRALLLRELPEDAHAALQQPCLANRILGTYVGTDPAGVIAWPNTNGINIEGKDNIVAAGTVVSANRERGVRLFGDNNLVLGATIGPNVDGTNVVFNADQQRGITIFGANNLVCSSHIADNKEGGIFFEETSTHGHVAANFIGTDAAGRTVLGLQSLGVALDGIDHLVGGDNPDAANLISGHLEDGILVRGGSHVVRNNRIGTDYAGCVALPNGTNGINVLPDFPVTTQKNQSVQRNRAVQPIVLTARDNLIAGNGITGLRIARGLAFVTNNIIGLNAAEDGALPNKEKGVAVLGDAAAFINENNVGFNGDLEVPLDAHTGIGVTLPAQAAIISTPSFANIAKGIGYFEFDGVRAAPIAGPAIPELTSVLSFGSFISIKGRLTGATPQATYQIEFFSNEIDRIEATEGTEVLGMLETLETDEFGNADFAIAMRLQRGVVVPFISATATLLLPDDDSGEYLPVSTSEFSANIEVT